MSAADTVPRTVPARPRPAPAAPPEPPREPLRVELTEGPEAESLLASPEFQAAWDALAAACPWATVFQRRGFASIWMDVYGGLFIPVVVTGTDETGRLAALMVFAAAPDRRRLSVVGAHQNEYQAWLALPVHGETFMPQCLDALRAAFPSASLTLMNVPPATPLGWTRDGGAWAGRVRVEKLSRALRDLGGDDKGFLKKKGNKSRLRQLARRGEVKFERVTDRAAYLRLLDELIPIHDLRQGAVHGVLPFGDDARKRLFHERLFDLPGFLYVTSLRSGGTLVAAQLGVADGTTLSVGPHSYAPEFARQSPGKLQMHLLASQLAEDGFTTLDLTPGPGWKDRFATRQDEVSIVRVFFRAADRLRYDLLRRRDALAKKVALRLGWTPDRVREVLGRADRRGAAGLAAAALHRVADRLRPYASKTIVVWTAPAEHAAAAARKLGAGTRFRANAVEDILGFRPGTPWETRDEFLSTALARLSAGHICLTLAEEGRLVCRGWVAPPGTATGRDDPDSRPSAIAAAAPVPADVAILYDFAESPSVRGRGLCEAAIAEAMAAAAEMPGCRSVWMDSPAGGTPVSRLLAGAGFTELTTLREERRFGRTVRRPDHRALHVQPGWTESAALAVKRTVFRGAKALGLFRLARKLTARDLRILCWHGFDLTGESAFGPRLFQRADTFERRLDALVAGGYPVLPLREAVQRLASRTLPDAAVVLTIDDGAASTVLRGAEPLARRNLPATLYVTTYHVEHPTPVFETSLRYLVWRSSAERISLAGIGPYTEGELDLGDENAVRAVTAALIRHAKRELDEPGRQALGRLVAERLGLDWDEHCASRRCSLTTPEELRDLAGRGIDLQLHTHRHRFPPTEADTFREILENRAALERILPGRYDQLCYPSSEYDPVQFPWLRAAGVRSATTCNVGLNPPGTHPLALNRFLDGECVSQIEFEAEVSGFAELCRRAARVLRRR